jgi:proline dehydrogenase
MSLCIATRTTLNPSHCRHIRPLSSKVIHRAHVRWQSNAAIKANSGTVAFPDPSQIKTHSSRTLARLPLSSIVRSLVLGTFFTSSLLSRPGIAILNVVARSRSSLLNPDKNPLVKAIVKPLVYDHFCAGITKEEIQRTSSKFKNIGYSGVILCYGKEFDPTKKHEDTATGSVDPDLLHWRQGNLETLDMLKEGDVLGMK